MNMFDEETTPTDVLRAEHQIILRVVESLRKLLTRAQRDGSFPAAALRRCVEFFRLFADACHHAKEEDLLFPVLEARGIPRENGPIGVMLHEHELARSHTRAMAQALDAEAEGDPNARVRFHLAAQQYSDLLTNHIFKEDNVLFRMGDQVMQRDDVGALCSRFCAVGCRKFEGRTREELARLAAQIEAECDHE